MLADISDRSVSGPFCVYFISVNVANPGPTHLLQGGVRTYSVITSHLQQGPIALLMSPLSEQLGSLQAWLNDNKMINKDPVSTKAESIKKTLLAWPLTSTYSLALRKSERI